MGGKSLFERDFGAVEIRFPKLMYSWSSKIKSWLIVGELDICDTKGIYWDTFNIAIVVPQSYPYCIPVLVEKSEIIPRNIEWHISSEGICCFDITHNLIVMSKVGINICRFINDKIYTYLANQLYKLADKKYAGKEYGHHLDGIIQYYIEEHHLPDENAVISLLHQIVIKSGISRNDKCPCGSGEKIKICHQQSINTIKMLGIAKIKTDLENIKADQNRAKNS